VTAYIGYLVLLYLIIGAAVGLFSAPDPDRFLFVLTLWPVYLLMLVVSGLAKTAGSVFDEEDDDG